ncbi:MULTISPECIES: transposase [unclassified Streptomyces]|uniref:transposase n=1 Tax=unclassified Streptomyces TaxID=2593676 RepID=UPI003804E9E3
MEKVRKDLARDLVAEVRTLDKQLVANATDRETLVTAAKSTLMHTPGIGPVLAARLIAHVGRASRFPTAAAFSNYTGTAPVEIASADKSRHRLSRSGDRQLNCVLHTIAISQIRMPNSPSHVYYQRRLSEGKTPREARRCLKRRLADHVWRVMLADERRSVLLSPSLDRHRGTPGGRRPSVLCWTVATRTSSSRQPPPARECSACRSPAGR